ncbi:MAG: hypothetical protein ACYCX4_01380 [Bacillota bacterium]
MPINNEENKKRKNIKGSSIPDPFAHLDSDLTESLISRDGYRPPQERDVNLTPSIENSPGPDIAETKNEQAATAESTLPVQVLSKDREDKNTHRSKANSDEDVSEHLSGANNSLRKLNPYLQVLSGDLSDYLSAYPDAGEKSSAGARLSKKLWYLVTTYAHHSGLQIQTYIEDAIIEKLAKDLNVDLTEFARRWRT